MFGYISIKNETFYKKILKKILGWPHITRRLQALKVMQYLNPQKGEIILDIGAANGNYSFEISKDSLLTIALEYDSVSLKGLAKTNNFNSTIAACSADACRLPFKDSSVDKILISGTLQALDGPSAIKESERVLKPGGTIIIVVLVEHPFTKYLYKYPQNTISRLVLKKFKLPDTLSGYEKEYCSKVNMNMFYSLEKLVKICSDYGLNITNSRFVPSGIATFMIELHHLIFWKSNKCLINNRYFFAFSYPFFFIGQLLSDKINFGNELISKFYKPI